MAKIIANLLPRAAALLAEQQEELPQMDELCGAFWATVTLRASGHRSHGKQTVDQELVAECAGTTISDRAYDDHLPRGENHRNGYTRQLPRTTNVTEVGTSATGVGRALEILSEKAIAAIPVVGPWSSDTVREVLRIAIDNHAGAVLANLATGFLADPRPEAQSILGYLIEGDIDIADHPWPVGHFVGVLGWISGQGGELAILADTYRSQGFGGVHVQPLHRLAVSLERPGLSAGGLIVAVDVAREQRCRDALRQAGMRLEWWDNGSVDLGLSDHGGR